MTRAGAFAGIATGAVTVLIWHYVPALKSALYELVPGFFVSLLAVCLVSRFTRPPQESVRQRAAAAANPLPWEVSGIPKTDATAFEVAKSFARFQLQANRRLKSPWALARESLPGHD